MSESSQLLSNSTLPDGSADLTDVERLTEIARAINAALNRVSSSDSEAQADEQVASSSTNVTTEAGVSTGERDANQIADQMTRSVPSQPEEIVPHSPRETTKNAVFLPQADENTPISEAAKSDVSGLEAAIAAELGGSSTPTSPPALEPTLAPAPSLEPHPSPSTPEMSPPSAPMPIPQPSSVKPPESDLALLSHQMRSILHELSQDTTPLPPAITAFLDALTITRSQLTTDIRNQMAELIDALTQRQQVLIREINNITTQAESLQQAIKTRLAQFDEEEATHLTTYQQGINAESGRLARYREFLQFLLDERNTTT